MIAVIHNHPDNENEPSLLQTRNRCREITVEGTNHWKHFEKTITPESDVDSYPTHAPQDPNVCFASFSFCTKQQKKLS